jgi:flagellar basal body P-ring formation protein FlgA
MIRHLIFAATALLALASAASADPERPKLKAEATVTGSIVRVGDLIEHAGVIANVPIFRAPDLGSTGSVPADAVVEAVRRLQLIELDTGGVSEVVVTRASRVIPAKDIETRVAKALSTQFALGPVKDIQVNFDRELRAIQLETSAKGEPRVGYLNYDGQSGRFDVTLDMPTGATTRGALHLSGRATATVEIVTLAHALERGGTIKAADVALERRPRATIGRDAVTDSAQVIGLAARNSMLPGRPLRLADLTKPAVVLRNETVTLTYQVPGITLTVRGKATESGAEGDVISVLNEQSKRTLQGVVSGPGRVTVTTGSPRLAANLPPSK